MAIGGGSVLDAAKLAWVFYEQPEAEAPAAEPAESEDPTGP